VTPSLACAPGTASAHIAATATRSAARIAIGLIVGFLSVMLGKFLALVRLSIAAMPRSVTLTSVMAVAMAMTPMPVFAPTAFRLRVSACPFEAADLGRRRGLGSRAGALI